MDSACYVYAIVGRESALPTSGLSRGSVELAMVPCRELAAVTARTANHRASISMEAVLHHEAVIEAVRRHTPALPVRFGTVFRDTMSVASALADQHDPLAADLSRLGDKVELSLTALWIAPLSSDRPAAAESHSDQRAGARYLNARVFEFRRQEALRDRARVVAQEFEVLGRLAIEHRVSLLPTPRAALRAVYLLHPSDLPAFRSAFEALRTTCESARVLLTGPWPPYSFVKTSRTEADRSPLSVLVQQLTETMRPAEWPARYGTTE